MRKHLLAGALALTIALPYLAFAAAEDYTGLKTTGEAAFGTIPDSKKDISLFIGGYIIAPVLGLLGLVFFVFTLYGGVLWMTAGGNGDQVKKATVILRNGFIGLFIIAASYAITNAILNIITNGTIIA